MIKHSEISCKTTHQSASLSMVSTYQEAKVLIQFKS